MDNLISKIQSMNLTKTEKVIADYILDNINNIGLSTVTDISLKLGVSDTSIIRFIRLLGFAGFADFKNTMKERMLEHYNLNLSPSQKFTNTKDKINSDNVVNDVFYKAIDNLSSTMLNLDDKLVNSIAECIIKSRNKYIIGFRGTSCCADYFTRKAVFFVPHLILCNMAESSVIEKLIDLNEEDCLVMFSFPRYSEINYSILELAKKRGSKIILITDRVTSPLVPYADYLLTVKIDGVGFTNSYVVPLCVAESLAILICEIFGSVCKNRVGDLDFYITKNNLY